MQTALFDPSALRSLKGLLPEELETLAVAEGAPKFAGRQLLGWLYRHGSADWNEMTNIRKPFRAILAERYRLQEAVVAHEQQAADGTTKLLVELADGARVESVIIPEPARVTLCISTQVGCGRGCAFCATARMKLRRNLTAAEIVEQVIIARRRAAVSNVVFMGMGEPLDNYDNVRRAAVLLASPLAFGISPRHLTVSTVGVVPHIRRLAADRVPVRLTVSLTAPDDELRSRLMPINRQWPIAELLAAVHDYMAETRREITFAYVLLKGINDSPRQAAQLAALVRPLNAKVNLIPYNQTLGFERPDEATLLKFQTALKVAGVLALVRRERGGGIAAACGQLATAVPGKPEAARPRPDPAVTSHG